MAETSFPYLRKRAYLAATLTHFTVDVLNSSRTLVVALLAISLGLTNQQVGIALIVYNLGAALTQPLFGLLAALFRSLRDSLLVCLALPLATVGGVLALRLLDLLTPQPLDLLLQHIDLGGVGPAFGECRR